MDDKTEEWRRKRMIMILNGCSPLDIEIARDKFFESNKDNKEEE
jgi:hypothetical protein